jgi:hypothetical protein
MNREATEKLRLDRRLIRRRGWISAGDVDKALAGLPDVSHKIAAAEESGTPAAPPASQHPAARRVPRGRSQPASGPAPRTGHRMIKEKSGRLIRRRRRSCSPAR